MKLRASAMAARIWSALAAAPSTGMGMLGSMQWLWPMADAVLSSRPAINRTLRTCDPFRWESLAHPRELALGVKVLQLRRDICRKFDTVCPNEAGRGKSANQRSAKRVNKPATIKLKLMS